MTGNPAWIDILRDGVPAATLRRSRCGGDCAVRAALVSTACGARGHGWTYPHWAGELDSPVNRLGAQAKIERGRVLSPLRYRKRLQAAWQRAEEWQDERGPAWTPAGIVEHIADVRMFVAEAPLGADERKVLEYACDEAERLQTFRPALPRRKIAATTGLSERRVKAVLAHLDDLGLLTLAKRGNSATDPKHWRSSLYRLPDEMAQTAYLTARIPGASGLRDALPAGARPKWSRP